MAFWPGTEVQKPTHVYATNATFPYMNDWCIHAKHKGDVGTADILRAQDCRQKQEARKEAKRRRNLLFAAIQERNYELVVHLFKECPFLLSSTTRYGTTLIAAASLFGDVVLVQLLLEQGADILKGDHIGATPLILASSKGHDKVVQLLFDSKQGGNAGREYLIRQTTRSGEAAIMAAAKGGHTDVLKLLLVNGGKDSVNACTRAGMTALMMACTYDRVECAIVLLSSGCIPGQCDDAGRDSAMHAAIGGAHQVLALLLKKHRQALDMQRQDTEGHTALHHACMSGSIQCAELLLASGANLNPSDPILSPSLLRAACRNEQGGAMVTWLLKRGIGVQCLMDPCAGHPLFTAVRYGSITAVDALLAAGCRIEVQDLKGCTPLAVAAQTGNSKMVQTLVNRGANMLATDHKGRVPRQLAQAANHRCTAELLSALAKESMIDKAVMREDVEQAGVGALQDVGQNRTPGWSYWRRHMS